jgi:trimeric autotransporter adhesin
LQTARTINGVSFNGTANITVAATDATKLPLAGGTMTGLLVGKTATTTTVAAANDTGSFSVRGSTTMPAVMSFHRSGAYAVNFGLSTANKMELGGWSATTIKHTWDMSGNYNAVGTITGATFSGSGASLTSLNGSNISSGTVAAARVATLNQSTTGNAATATTLQTARTINGVSFNGSANITVADATKLPLAGGTTTGLITVNGGMTIEGCAFFNGTDAWIRALGATGLYFSTYGGGIYMPDATYTTIYGSKAFKVNSNIVATGTITAYFSDERLKTKTRGIDSALSKVCSLNGFYYTHNALAIENGYKDDGEHLGLSAQEIQAIAPEIVTPAPFDVLADEHIDGKFTSKTGEDYLTVDYSKLVPLLIEAIKEQDSTINSLRNDVETLKDLVNKLMGTK